MRRRLVFAGIVAVAILGIGMPSYATALWLPPNFGPNTAFVYTEIQALPDNGSNPYYFDSVDSVQQSTLPISASGGLHLAGVVASSDPLFSSFDVGDYITFGSGSVSADKVLAASASISGTVAANRYATADAYGQYWDALRVSGPVTPGGVVFHLSASSTSSAAGSNWTNPLAPLTDALDFTIWDAFDPTTGNILSGHYQRLSLNGDGSTQTMDVYIPWSDSFNSELIFDLEMTAFGRAITGATDANVQLSNSATGKLDGVTILDASGNDITSLETINLLPVPEPPEVLLLSLALLAIAGSRAGVRKEGGAIRR